MATNPLWDPFLDPFLGTPRNHSLQQPSPSLLKKATERHYWALGSFPARVMQSRFKAGLAPPPKGPLAPNAPLLGPEISKGSEKGKRVVFGASVGPVPRRDP